MASSDRHSGLRNHAEQAYRQVRDLLVSGRFQPGDRLTELDLSDELSMSRTPIREALRRLQGDGLVTPTGRGVVVATLSSQDMRHALELQGALESLAAELAAVRQRDGLLAPASLAELRQAGRTVEEAAASGNVLGAWQANLCLHRLIAELSGNPLLVESLDRIWARFAIVTMSNLGTPRRLRPTHAQHQAVLDAVVDGDPARAAQAARKHVADGAHTYLDV